MVPASHHKSRVRNIRFNSQTMNIGILCIQVIIASIYIAIAPDKCFSASGDLDPSFGNKGIVITKFDKYEDIIKAIAVQQDGKIVVTGQMYTLSTKNHVKHMTTARYNADGTLDTTFGDQGKIIETIDKDSHGTAVALQQNGNIVVAGYASNVDTEYDTIFTVYDTNGVNLVSKSGHYMPAIRRTLSLRWDGAASVLIQNGNIVLTGSRAWILANQVLHNTPFAIRYKADWSQDASFGSSNDQDLHKGVAYIDLQYKDTSQFYLNASVLQPDGKIVSVGTQEFDIGGSRSFLLRFTADGFPDTSFNASGATYGSAASGCNRGDSVALQADGKIIIAGRYPLNTGNNTTGLCLCRYNVDGSLDTTFGDDGVTKIGNPEVSFEGGPQIAIKSDASIIVAAHVNGKFSAHKFNSDGSRDTSFGTDGSVITSIGTNVNKVYAIAIQQDGNILVGGTAFKAIKDSFYNFALVRYFDPYTAEACKFAVSPTVTNYDSTGGSQAVTITASASDCAWTASSNLSWVHLSAYSGSGSSAVTVTVDPNASSSSRTGTISIAGKSVSITQAAAAACTYAVSSLTSFPSDGATQTLAVTASSSNCAWTASVNGLSWVHLSAASGTGSGSLTVTADRNNTSNTRSATITIAGVDVTVTQAGAASCSYSLSSLSNFTAAGGSQNVTVTASASNCSWTASANSLSWAHLSTTSGTGSGTLTVSVDENTGTSSRNGTISIAGQSLAITQNGASACLATLSALADFPGASSYQALDLTVSTATCNWTATTDTDWITIYPASGTGDGTLVVSVKTNPDSTSRSGTFAVANKTVTITQEKFTQQRTKLPDTGQSKCYNATNEIPCPSANEAFYGQDGNYSGKQKSYQTDSGMVSDLVTGLMWQQSDDGVKRDWLEACVYCKNLTLGNYADWRLPSRKELLTIIDEGRIGPSTNPVFGHTSAGMFYWSSTSYGQNKTFSWYVGNNYGNAYFASKTNKNYSLCVRGAYFD
ncbi:MAG: BACON domain-containing protein [Solidesulfovibrio sp. DCME]|uniref:BACON domain-containing protein n=1 Tax=Solidesulfovibrio sp. DCME TaxID=3447380 RepID=UPI003D1298A5